MTIYNNSLVMEVLEQSKVRFTASTDPRGQERKQPVCYIHLKEMGGVKKSSEFWAKMEGDNALLVFKPGQKVRVKLSFHVHKNSRKIFQRVTVDEISRARIWDYLVVPSEEDSKTFKKYNYV